MAQITVEIKYLDELRSFFRSRPRKVAQELDKAIRSSAILIQRNARMESPVDLGRLRSSIGVRLGKLEAAVGPGVKYGLWVHEGTGIYARNGQGRRTPWTYVDRRGAYRRTRGTRPNPFMERAAESSREPIQREFDRAVKRIVGDS